MNLTTTQAERVRNLVAVGRSALSNSEEMADDENFATVVSGTFRSFRRRREPDLRRTKRGRKATTTWKCRVFLVKRSNIEFWPSVPECKHLEETGYGSPTTANEDGYLQVNRNWSLDNFKLFLSEQYPAMSLGVVGFSFAKSNKGKKLTKLEAESIRDLEKSVGRGKLVLIPDRDLGTPVESGTPTVTFNHPNEPDVAASSDGSSHSTTTDTSANASSRTEVPAAATSSDGSDNSTTTVTPVNPSTSSSDISAVATSSAGISHSATTFTSVNTSTSSIALSGGSSGHESLAYEEASDFDLMEDYLREEYLAVEQSTKGCEKLELEVQRAFFELNSSLEGELTLNIRRQNVMETLLDLYMHPRACTQKMKVIFEDESGEDLGGLTKEMLTMFWNSATKEYFCGEHVAVPCLPLHRLRKEKWKFRALGRALTHTVALTGSLPCRLAVSGLTVMIFDCEVNQEYLMTDFLLFISPTEKAMVERAIKDFSSLSQAAVERLTTFFNVNGLMEIPKASEIKDQIHTIAEEKLIKEPSRFYSMMKEGIPETHLDIFWHNLSLEHIAQIINSQRPTPAKVAASLRTENEDLRPEEERVLYYLREFVSSLDTDDLMNFLMFVTSSIHMPVDGITVGFVATSGILRRPVAHTCSNVLEVSTSYSSIQEFRREMKMYLGDEYSYQYTLL